VLLDLFGAYPRVSAQSAVRFRLVAGGLPRWCFFVAMHFSVINFSAFIFLQAFEFASTPATGLRQLRDFC
jgi:hypothetical protein